MLKIPEFETKKELFAFLIENDDKLIAQKKATKKEADGFLYSHIIDSEGKLNAKKNNEPIDATDLDTIKVVAIINTTNILDSHEDVHIPGIWKKSLSEVKGLMHIQEHKSNEFDKIISYNKDLKAFTKYYTWAELNYPFAGKTQALVFNSIVRRSVNEAMFKRYAGGLVENHSIAMRYVKIVLCVNDVDYKEYYDNWKKYIDKVANRNDAENLGYFYAVTEAKVIEGSAVPRGSNEMTPTISVTPKNATQLDALKYLLEKPFSEPLEDTPKNTQIEILRSLNKMNN